MASNEKVTGRKKLDITSLALVAAVVAGAGGLGWVLWNQRTPIQGDQTSAAAAAPAAVISPDAIEPEVAADPNSKVMRMLSELQSRSVEPAVNPPAAVQAARPDPSADGIITIISKSASSTTRVPAGAPASSNVAPDVDYASQSNNNGGGPKVYTTRDPNLDKPPEPRRSGKPRYYDFDHKDSYSSPDDDSQFQRRTIYKSR